ncbi:histidine phosphatase family protein [Ascidiaceihabitans sp.]|uniref:histidine phosphatase family protein n=1 Tax=Ascidiaceihabitans sp. TaxID=1872644 RepID=UPI003297C937
MAELVVVRHGQAAFGQENYDQLSDVGFEQARLAGDILRQTGWVPDRLVSGTLERQRDTLSAMKFDGSAEEHAGFNEYDFGDLLRAKYHGNVPELVKGDRKVHFRTLRETVFEWQDDQLDDPHETWGQFETRVAEALKFATDTDARRVLVVSSGGVIGQLVASTMQAPKRMMMEVNLQIKNASITRFVFSKGRVFVTGMNATPHLDHPDTQHLMTYS